MKLLVETTGDFMLYDMSMAQTISAFRPSVVTNSSFIENHKLSKLRIIEELADEAEDSMLEGAEDLEAAIAALPRPSKDDPLDHDGDGRKGGSRPRRAATAE